jgi:hypothetical protein
MERELNIKIDVLLEREFVNLKDLKYSLGTSQNTIYRLCERKELNKYKFRGKNWFRTDEVISYLNSIGVLITSVPVKI